MSGSAGVPVRLACRSTSIARSSEAEAGTPSNVECRQKAPATSAGHAGVMLRQLLIGVERLGPGQHFGLGDGGAEPLPCDYRRDRAKGILLAVMGGDQRGADAADHAAGLANKRSPSHAPTMFIISDADAAAIRAIFRESGELSAALELRRLFPGIIDTAHGRLNVQSASMSTFA